MTLAANKANGQAHPYFDQRYILDPLYSLRASGINRTKEEIRNQTIGSLYSPFPR